MKNFYLKLFKMHWRQNFLIGGLMVLNASLAVVVSQITIMIIDDILPSGSARLLAVAITGYLVVSFLQAFVSFIQTVLSTKLTQNITLELRSELISCLLSRNTEYLSSTRIGDIQNTVNADAQTVVSFYTETIYSVISNLSVAVCMIIYLSVLQWDLLLIVLLIQPLVYILQASLGKIVYRKASEVRASAGKYMSLLQEIISNANQFIAFGLKSYLVRIFRASHSELNGKLIKEAKVSVLSSTSLTIISVFLFVAILGIGGYKIQLGVMTLGILVAFIQYSQQLLQPFSELFSLKIQIEETRPSFERISYLTEPYNDDHKESLTPEKWAKIEYKNISFSYPDAAEIPVFKDFSAEFNIGSIYGVVGKSGIGKSTLFYLLMKLYAPQKGEIQIDGISIKDIASSEYYRHITYINQVPFILNATIQENIILDLPLSDDNLKKAIALSGLTDDIAALPQGVKYAVYDNGANLSVGQRQRIGLARAYYRNSPIIIFDEPTASIGEENTAVFLQHLIQLKKNKIVIVITHDDNVVAHCDCIISLNPE